MGLAEQVLAFWDARCLACGGSVVGGGCLVVGEDLGTVPAPMRAALNEAGVLSYRPLLFGKDEAGEYAPPSAYPREALVCASTHDLPTWRGFWAGSDDPLDRRRMLPRTDAGRRDR